MFCWEYWKYWLMLCSLYMYLLFRSVCIATTKSQNDQCCWENLSINQQAKHILLLLHFFLSDYHTSYICAKNERERERERGGGGAILSLQQTTSIPYMNFQNSIISLGIFGRTDCSVYISGELITRRSDLWKLESLTLRRDTSVTV